MKSFLNFFIKLPRYIRFYRALRQSNYGRDYGWYIELEGECIGELVDVQWEDQFWFSYRVVPTSTKGEALVLRADLWNESRFRFKNKYLPGYAKHPFSSTAPAKDERVFMRGLNL